MAKIATKTAAKTKAPAKKSTVKKVVKAAAPIVTEVDEKKNVAPAPVAQETVQKTDIPQAKEAICVVIPYLHEKASGEELRYALRAWEKNLPNVQIVLIGDKPDYVSDLVHHIEAVDKGSNPQSDVAIKLMQAIASDFVPDFFILSNDDIYPIAPVDLELIARPFCAGILGDKKNATTGYAEKTAKTKAVLEENGYPTFDYGTHLPVAYHKESLAKIIAAYKADEEGLLISSLYFNSVSLEYKPEVTKGNAEGKHVAYIYRENPNAAILAEVFTTRKFINHNSAGYAPTLPFLQKHFPEASKFEK